MLKMIVGLDVGNGYVKGKATLNNKVSLIDLPSVISYTSGSDFPKEPDSEFMSDFVNELDCTVLSKSIKTIDTGRMFFGTRAIRTGESLREFNIDNHEPKCKDALSVILTLGSIASTAVKSVWEDTKKLPDNIDIEVCAGLALPIEDYVDWHDYYRTTLMSNSHSVIIHNFAKNITCNIVFKDVQVLAEGVAAQFAISGMGSEFLQLALDIARKGGANIDKAYTGEMLASAKNTIGIDIGEGNTNFPVFHNGNVSIESSKSLNKGYGSVLTAVVSKLRNTPYAFESRKDLADFLLQTENLMPAQQNVYNLVMKQVSEQVLIFARDVLKEYSNIFSKIGVRTDVIYIYGGGSGAVKDTLYPMILEASKLADNMSVPVIYLDASYSRDLNRTGLYRVAELGAQSINFNGDAKK
jgi:hypothetical protein